MELLTKDILDKLPPLGSTEKLRNDAIVQVKFFTPDGGWTWWGIEFDAKDGLFYGLVQGFELEFGYFSLDELKEVKGVWNLSVERDLYFKPISLGELLRQLGRES